MKVSAGAYQQVRQVLRETCGVELGADRAAMVASRLNRRVTRLGLNDVNHYIEHLLSLPREHDEWQMFIDGLTTHETYFYREAQHFEFLRKLILPHFRHQPLRILSAACSTGEEVYTLAFEVAACLGLGADWQIHGCDISTGVLNAASHGVYEESRAKLVPEDIRKRYMKKGVRDKAGLCLVKPAIRRHVSFGVENLLQPATNAKFDVIFCRNVLIYFEEATKRQVVDNLYRRLKPGGHLIVSRTEQLRRFLADDVMVSSSIARRPPA